MEGATILYDHYKETMHMHLDMQKKRNTLFVAVCIAELLNLSMLLFPGEIGESVRKYIYTTYRVTFEFDPAYLQSAIWIVVTYALVRYFQTNIYIERQYGYIAMLEERLSQMLNEKCFDRESSNYLDEYPKVLDMIHVFYTWLIPISIVLVCVIKSIREWVHVTNYGCVVFDSVFSIFCVVLTILYLCMLHPRKKNA